MCEKNVEEREEAEEKKKKKKKQYEKEAYGSFKRKYSAIQCVFNDANLK